MKTKVKICGIRTFEASQVAIDNGADFMGFNFVENSTRYIKPEKALEIIKLLKDKLKIVGVFQDHEINYVNEIVGLLNLDFVQLHGVENNEYIKSVKVPVIKSITMNNNAKKIKAKYLLLDRIKRGEGEMVDFKNAAKLASKFPIFLAGGLTPDNIAKAITNVRPFAVDVAGGIETNGFQDLEKLKLFIKNAKGVIL